MDPHEPPVHLPPRARSVDANRLSVPKAALIVASPVLATIVGILTNVLVSAPSISIAVLLTLATVMTVGIELAKERRGFSPTARKERSETDQRGRAVALGYLLVACLYHVGQVVVRLLVAIGWTLTWVFNFVRYLHVRAQRRRLTQSASLKSGEFSAGNNDQLVSFVPELPPLPPIMPSAPANEFAWRGAAAIIAVALSAILGPPADDPTSTESATTLLLSDDFSVMNGQWDEKASRTTTVQREGGALLISSASPALLVVAPQAARSLEDPSVKVATTFQVRNPDRSGLYGILCRYSKDKNGESYYALVVRGDGYVAVTKTSPHAETLTLLDWTAPPSVLRR